MTDVKETTKDVLKQPESLTVKPVEFEDPGTTDIRNISDLVEVVDTEPTSDPVKFYGQLKIYNGILYFYDYVARAWKKAGSTMIDRGHLTSYNLSPTIDGAWHTWDMSSIIPVGTRWARIKVRCRSTIADQFVQIKEYNVTDDVNTLLQSAGLINTYVYRYFDVPITDQKLDYKVSTSFNAANMVVLAYE